MPGLDWERLFYRAFAAENRPPFRGGVIENLAETPMGKGHGNHGQPFNLETACYLKPVFAAYDAARRRDERLKLVLQAGVKTIKSFALEICAAEHVCHGRGDAAIFFATGETADVGATTRILDFYRSIPEFAAKLRTIADRFDDTKGALKFPDKTLFILAANLSNTQQKNLAFVGLQDAFLTEATGMIEEMLARTTQYEATAIVFLESQGGEKGYDFDRHYESTDQRELHVTCPHCGTSHLWNWKAWDMVRPDDFQAVLPRSEQERITQRMEAGDERNPLSAANHALGFELAWAQEELSTTLRQPARRHCGFKRGADELIKLPGGEYNEQEILNQTHFECFHCGGLWRDDGEFGPTRVGLDQSSHYVAARTDALPWNVGFNIPQWVNRRLSWGKIMLEKLLAQKIYDTTGNLAPLKKWWQKVAARTWDPDLMARHAETQISVGSYELDPAKLIPDEHSRNLAVDCQKDETKDTVGTFWYVARAFDKFGNSRQLARGFARSWEEWIAVQKFWKIPNARVCIDSSHWTPQIMLRAASEYEEVARWNPMTQRQETYKSCWRLFFGDDARAFKVANGASSTFSPGQPTAPVVVYDKEGRRIRLTLFKYRWSNLMFELQLDAILDGGPGMPRFEALPREKLTPFVQSKEAGILTYEKQMKARYKTEVRGKEKFVDIDNREAHYRDCELMQLVRASQDGLLGHVAVGAGEAAPETGVPA